MALGSQSGSAQLSKIKTSSSAPRALPADSTPAAGTCFVSSLLGGSEKMWGSAERKAAHCGASDAGESGGTDPPSGSSPCPKHKCLISVPNVCLVFADLFPDRCRCGCVGRVGISRGPWGPGPPQRWLAAWGSIHGRDSARGDPRCRPQDALIPRWLLSSLTQRLQVGSLTLPTKRGLI